ncbi:MAG: ABC transporter, partial [Firmicutes bacterium]|nr:ABC transporter [Bacillota bacterium]
MGNSLIYTVMVDGARIWELPLNDILIAIAVGVAYLAVGIVIFSQCENVAKSRGLLGHY